MRQVARARRRDTANLDARSSARRSVGELERRAGQIVEERHELGAESPQRDARQLVRTRRSAGATRGVEPGLRRSRCRGARDRARRVAPLGEERVDRAGREDRVGGGDERPARVAPPASARRTASAEPSAAAGARSGRGRRTPSRRRASDSTCSARCPVTTVTRSHPARRELAQQRRDDRTPVDRQHRLGPALGDRPQAPSLARGHDDGVHCRRSRATAARRARAPAAGRRAACAAASRSRGELLARARRGRRRLGRRTEARGCERRGEAAPRRPRARRAEARRARPGAALGATSDALVGEEVAQVGPARRAPAGAGRGVA